MKTPAGWLATVDNAGRTTALKAQEAAWAKVLDAELQALAADLGTATEQRVQQAVDAITRAYTTALDQALQTLRQEIVQAVGRLKDDLAASLLVDGTPTQSSNSEG